MGRDRTSIGSAILCPEQSPGKAMVRVFAGKLRQLGIG